MIIIRVIILMKVDMLVTGDTYKPSDRRIKTHIEVVDNLSQLSRVRQLKIYDYQVHDRSERGGIK